MRLPPAGTPPAVASEYICLPAKCPNTGNGDTQVLISRRMLEDLEAKGPTRKFYDAQSLPDVLENPVAIFEGLNRTQFQAGFCYSGLPPFRWIDEQVKGPLPPWKVFLVYVCPVGGDLVVLDWNWRFADRVLTGFPKNWRQDYVRQKWPPPTS